MYQKLLNFAQSNPIPRTYSQLRYIIKDLYEETGIIGYYTYGQLETVLNNKIARARRGFLRSNLTKREAIASAYLSEILVIYIDEIAEDKPDYIMGYDIRSIFKTFEHDRTLTNFDITFNAIGKYKPCVVIEYDCRQSCEHVGVTFYLGKRISRTKKSR